MSAQYHDQTDAMDTLLTTPPVPLHRVEIPMNIYHEVNQLILAYPLTYDSYANGLITEEQLRVFCRRAFAKDLHCRYSVRGKVRADMKGQDIFMKRWIFGSDMDIDCSFVFHNAQPLVVLDYNEERQEVIGRILFTFYGKDKCTGKLLTFSEDCLVTFRREETWKIYAYIVTVDALKSDTKSKL